MKKIIAIIILIIITGGVWSFGFAQDKQAASAMAQAGLFDPKGRNIDFVVSGARFNLEGVEAGIENEIFICPHDSKIPDIAAKLGSNYRIDEKENVVIITRDADECKIYLNEMRFEINKEISNQTIKSLAYNNKLYMPARVLFKLLGGQVVYDERNEKYYCDPMVTGVELVKNQSRYLLKITASGPVNFNYFYLREPQRYVLDVQNAILVTDAKETGNDDIGVIKFSQFNSKPNIVRFVIPLDKDIEVQAQPRTFLNQIVFAVDLPKVATSVRNFSQAKIEEVDVKHYKDGVIIKVQADAPIQYQWHRLKPPDNRMFIDIPDGILIDKAKKFEIKGSDYVENIRVAQFQTEPKPITRIVVNFKKPAECSVSGEAGNKLIIETKDVAMKEEDMAFSGAGVTSFPGKGKIICIDAGHGGSDTGAINRGLGLYEKNLNLDIAKRLSEILLKDGWNVLMTREIDEDVSSPNSSAEVELYSRAKVANEMKADIFLSIHCNSMYQAHWNGTSSHWYKKIDYDLAKTIQDALIAKIELKNKGVVRNRFYVLRVTKMPAVLVECAFMSNPNEANLLATEEFRQKLAEGIAEGLRAYISQQE